MNEKHFNLAFNLAEILITLTIIGVITVITIPQLIQKIQEWTWKQTWKKEYSTIVQAYERVKQDNGGDLSEYFSTTVYRMPKQIAINMGNYLSIIKTCAGFYSDNTSVCDSMPLTSFTNTYKDLSGAYFNQVAFSCGQYILADGSYIYFRTYNKVNYFTAWVDVNGFAKGPNIAGKDLFGLIISPDKAMPMGAVGTGLENTCRVASIRCPSAYGFDESGSKCAGVGCSAEYLYN